MSEESNIFFSVVIPTYERVKDLKVCLQSLKKEFQLGSPNYEILVTDDSKSEESRRMVENEFPDVSWGRGKHNGPAGNRNAGAARAKGEWIVFLDDDCIAQQGYLDAYAKAIRSNPNILVFEGRIFADRPKRTWAEGCPENEQGGMLWTSNICVGRKLFIELGKFDERFTVAFEDVDFAQRINDAGVETRFVYAASVCHPWRTLKQTGKNWKPIGYEWIELKKFLNKHPNARNHNSPFVYLRHLKRMVTKDIATCIIKYKGAGLSIWLNNLITTIYVILKLLKRNIKVEDFLTDRLPFIYSLLASMKRTPNYEKILYLRKVKVNHVILDIGANEGIFTTLFAKLVKSKGKVYCFEPVSINFNRLKQNVDSFSWVSCHKIAAGDKNESRIINFSESDLQKSTLINNNDLKDSQKEEIDLVRIDDFMNKSFGKEVHFIKCDVEGYEFESLLGMKNLLTKFNPKLSIEITIEYEKRTKLFQFLLSCGYKNFLKIEKGFPIIDPQKEIPHDSYFYLYATS